jgi:hypothetical protein
MKSGLTRPRPSPCIFEPLEHRALLSGTAITPQAASLSEHGAAVVAAKVAAKSATKTTLAIASATVAQPVVFTVSVSAPVAAGAPTGTVQIIDHGKVLQTIVLAPTASTNAKLAAGGATYTLTQQIGGGPYFFGKHVFTAKFIPSGSFLKSTGSGTFTVIQPTYTTLSDGVKTATAIAGSGAAITTGQTADVFYTGFLEKSGKIFDDSVKDGGSPFSFTIGSGNQVITGFDEGTNGMNVGETRLIFIPPAEGYGSFRNGPIPPNSILLFVVTLEAIT